MPDSDPNVLQIDPSDRRDKRVLLINMIGSAIIGALLSLVISAITSLSVSSPTLAILTGCAIVSVGGALLHRTLRLSSPGNAWMIRAVRIGSAVSVLAGVIIAVAGLGWSTFNSNVIGLLIIFGGVAFLCASIACEVFNTVSEALNPVYAGGAVGSASDDDEIAISRWNVLTTSPHNQLTLRQVVAIGIASFYYAVEHVAAMRTLGIVGLDNIDAAEVIVGVTLGAAVGAILGLANVHTRENLAYDATFTPLPRS